MFAFVWSCQKSKGNGSNELKVWQTLGLGLRQNYIVKMVTIDLSKVFCEKKVKILTVNGNEEVGFEHKRNGCMAAPLYSSVSLVKNDLVCIFQLPYGVQKYE